MDFVVLGFGLGAVVMVVGIALRDLAPRSHAVGSDHLAWTEVLKRRQRVRFYRGSGRVLTLLGALIAALTFVLLVIDPADSVGSAWLMAAFVLALVGFGAWVGYYVWQDSPRQRQARQLRRLDARMVRPSAPVRGGVRETGLDTPRPRSALRGGATARRPAATVSGRARQPAGADDEPEPIIEDDEALSLPRPSRQARPPVARPWLDDGAISWQAARSRRPAGEPYSSGARVEGDPPTRSGVTPSRRSPVRNRERTAAENGLDSAQHERAVDE